jgi:hypothetical protein
MIRLKEATTQAFIVASPAEARTLFAQKYALRAT